MDLALVMEPDADNPDVGDLLVTANRLILESELPSDVIGHACAQDLWIRLQHFLGEWYLDRREGVPYFRTLFRKGFSRSAVDSMFRRALLSSPFVEDVVSLTMELDRAARALAVAFTVLRVDGHPQTFPAFVIDLETQ